MANYYESLYASTGWVPTAGNSIRGLIVRRYISVNCDIAAADGDDNLDIDNIWWYLYSEIYEGEIRGREIIKLMMLTWRMQGWSSLTWPCRHQHQYDHQHHDDHQHDDDVDCWHGGCQAAWANWCHQDGANPIVLMTSSVNGDINTDTYYRIDAMRKRIFFLQKCHWMGCLHGQIGDICMISKRKFGARKYASQIAHLTTSLFSSELMWWHQDLTIWCWWWR